MIGVGQNILQQHLPIFCTREKDGQNILRQIFFRGLMNPSKKKLKSLNLELELTTVLKMKLKSYNKNSSATKAINKCVS